jgi:hypothetical protein
MRFVHSRCQLGLCHGGYTLDSRRDLRSIIELGEFVPPWAICLHVLRDVLHQIAETFPFMVPCALVVYIAKRLSIGLARGQYVGNQSTSKRG